MRLFFLPRQRSDEGVTSREGATTFHVVQQPVPWPRALATQLSRSAIRFVERVVAKTSRLRERLVEPARGTKELVYVLGRGPAAQEESMRRLVDIASLYGAVNGERTRPVAPGAGPSIYDAPGVQRARASPYAMGLKAPPAAGRADDAGAFARPPPLAEAYANKAAPYGDYGELFYGPKPITARAARRPTSRDDADYRAEARTASRGTDVEPDAVVAAAAADKVSVDYSDITVNLDYGYLGDRLYKMFEQTRRIEMERRGII